MALNEIKLPEIGEGVTEGELVKWLVKVGDKIHADQAIAEILTDKATVEVPCAISGTVKELRLKEGQIAPVGGVLIIVENDKAEAVSAKIEPIHSAVTTTLSEEKVEPKQITQPSSVVVGELPPAELSVLATPSTRRLARESGVDINQIKGTGLAGRVTRDDVLSSGGKTVTVSRPVVSRENQMHEERIPLKGIRRKIAEKMQAAKHIVPHFTLMDEANVTELVKIRESLKDEAAKAGVKVTYLPFIMKALIATAREFPMINASIDDAAEEIIYKHYFNIGFAADTPNGLLVPVLKDAENKTVLELSREIVELGTKAREGKLSLDEMKGATITITNIGAISGSYATPIINHPEVAILGMYKVQDRPIVQNGEIKIAKIMNITITADHRLIDGAVAARFLAAFMKRLENPGLLMLDMI